MEMDRRTKSFKLRSFLKYEKPMTKDVKRLKGQKFCKGNDA